MVLETATKIPPAKSGIDFLAASHFQIGNPEVSFDSNSTFKRDYPLKIIDKVQTWKNPPPASIMHGDPRVLEQRSINKEQFKNHVSCYEKTTSKNTLTKTNFKMDSDERVDSFQTTNNFYHHPMTGTVQTHGTKEPMKSYVPQGDKEKEVCLVSKYKEDFDTKGIVPKETMVNNTFKKTHVIQGDPRSHGNTAMFDTTYNQDLPCYQGHRKAVIPDDVHYPKTQIYYGKEQHLASTHQIDFKKKLPSIQSTCDRKPSSSDLLKTQYKNGDNRFNSFQTTAQDYIDPKCLYSTQKATVNMSRSSFPQGDGIPTGLRPETTVNRTDFNLPPKGYRNPIVDATNLHTLSKVDWGDDKCDYITTMNSDFPYKSARCKKPDNRSLHSNLSLQHGSVGSNEDKSLYKASYLPTFGVKKMDPNPVAVENLRKSYIVDSIRGLREFTTTQRESYSPKEIGPPKIVSGKLHRSSVPIGTLCQ